MAKIGTDTAAAAMLLAKGELVAIPTETVYGLAANAFDPEAVTRIFQTKNRPSFNPLIVHSDTWEKLEPFLREIPPTARKLGEIFWPGPLTILLPRNEIIPDLVTAGNDRVAVRIPRHPLTLELLAQLDFPLAAPSANPFGYISPTTSAHVQEQLGDKIPYILEGGAAAVGVESTIVGYEADGSWKLYRPGGVEAEALEGVLGPLSRFEGHTNAPTASGQLKSHYAPRTKVVFGPLKVNLQKGLSPKKTGVLAFRQKRADIPAHQQIVLSASGDMGEAARNLFSALRQLDAMGLDLIVAEALPEKGLGRAINDRLERAAAE
ncbi:MAG: L-threonylcarbamoyladenylate synthase [Bacteroidota bacterium]